MILARDFVTLSSIRDIESTYRFYKLQASTAAAPAKPTVKAIPPSGWSKTEPTYTEGSTNSLYFVDLTIFTDGSFSYSDVCLSSSYEAAKTAYNKATAASNTATAANTTANSKNAVFYSDTQPTSTGRKVYDIWFDTGNDNSMYFWNGSTWTQKQFGTGAIGEQAITADLLAANSVTADKIVARSITAAKIATGTITANEIAANTITATEIAANTITANEITTQNIVGANGWINLAQGTFNYGDGALSWNGSALNVTGNVTATSGVIGPWILDNNGLRTEYFKLWENGMSQGTYIYLIDKTDTNALTRLYPGTLSMGSSLASVAQAHISMGKNGDTYYGLAGFGNTSGNGNGVYISGLNGSLDATELYEDGVLISNKYAAKSHGNHVPATQTASNKKFLRCDNTWQDVTPANIGAMGIASANGYYGMTANGAANVYVRTTTLGLIPYQSGGSGTIGTSSWPFSTIYGSTIYEGGTALSSKYLGLSGGTVSGAIIASYNGAMIRATNPTHGNVYAGLHAASGGNVGVYTNGYWNGSALAGSGRWLIYRNTANNTCIESQLYTHNEGYTTLRPVVGTNAGTNAVGVIVSNSASFGIYGRWAGGATAAMSGRTISCPSSDIRLKENIKNSTVDALSVINAIKIRQFDWKDKSRGHWDCGMVVDEMEKDIDPKFCIGGEDEEDGTISYKSVDTFYLQGYEVKAIQELHAEVRSLKAEIAELKEIIAVLMEGKK